jgi:leader peptidase (prepilin peptidase) / N-methyltransferase
MANSLILIVPFIFGAIIGSFLNVCIYRIPLKMSIVYPASRCPTCGKAIHFYNNVPIFSYIVLQGRCAACGTPISAIYPFVEALTGLFALSLFAKFGLSAELFVYFAFVSVLIVVTFIDLKYQIIPDAISIPGIIAGFALSFFVPSMKALDSLIGIILGGGALFAIAEAYYRFAGKEGMGGGDIKLLGMIGAFLGWKGVIVTLFIGSFSGAIIGSVFMFLTRKGSKQPIPFGPFLAAGAIMYLFFGEALIRWYLTRAIGA